MLFFPKTERKNWKNYIRILLLLVKFSTQKFIFCLPDKMASFLTLQSRIYLFCFISILLGERKIESFVVFYRFVCFSCFSFISAEEISGKINSIDMVWISIFLWWNFLGNSLRWFLGCIYLRASNVWIYWRMNDEFEVFSGNILNFWIFGRC